VVAHDGALRPALEARAAQPDLAGKVRSSVGWTLRRKPAGTPGRWYLSLPASDSVSVSVLEAMGHGCIPILSDLPANRELVDDGRNGLILAEGELPTRPAGPLAAHADAVGARCRSGWGMPCSRTACRPMCSGSNNSAAGRMNILYLNHYAGTPALGMEYRPYYLAREWVRAGHRVTMVAADFSHVRARQPQAGTEGWTASLPLAAHAALPGQWPGPGEEHLGLPEAGLAAHAGADRRGPAGCGDRLQHLPDGHLGGAAHRPPGRGVLVFEVHDLWPLSPIELSGMSPHHPFALLCGWAEDGLPRCGRGGVHAAQGA
jgi:hypothetical protein